MNRRGREPLATALMVVVCAGVSVLVAVLAVGYLIDGEVVQGIAALAFAVIIIGPVLPDRR